MSSTMTGVSAWRWRVPLPRPLEVPRCCGRSGRCRVRGRLAPAARRSRPLRRAGGRGRFGEAAGGSGYEDAALAAVQRLAAAHLKPAGDAASDALTALVPLTGALPQLLPTTNAALAAALDSPRIAVSLPPEARAMPQARVLRLLTRREPRSDG